MADTFPTGYANRLVTMTELRERHEPKMHPEYARRIFACIEAADGLVGIGNGWRSTATQAANHAKAPNTFAPAGSSFHESHPWSSNVEAYAAVDTVGRHAQHQQAWNWMRDNAGRFGLCTFWDVNGEPWHTQFVDLPKGVKSWQASGCPDPPRFAVPGADAGADASVTIHSAYDGLPSNDAKPVVSIGWHGDLVSYVQRVIADRAGGKITVDGDFGPQTLGRVKDVQFVAKLATTGVVDWQGTWQFLDHLAGYDRTPPAPPSAAVEEVPDGSYWVQRGDSPWAVAQRVFGDGTRYTEFEPTQPPQPGFGAADHMIRLPGVAGRTTTVEPGDVRRTLIERLYPDRDWSSLSRRFVDLNGGEYRTLLPGETVFLDAPG
jgi:peptidoglycan hydrolase-like protein with peptidoglycan-binding domain